MKNRLIKAIACFVLLASTSVFAQEQSLYYFNPLVPQVVFENPALHNAQRKVVVGVAGLSGFHGELSTDANFSQLVEKKDGYTQLDISRIADNITGDGEFDQSFSLPLAFVGLNLRQDHFFFSLRERENFSAFLDKDLVNFLAKGNSNYIGRTVRPEMDFTAYQYSEMVLGYSRDLLDNRLKVGASVKLLFGKAVLQSEGIKMNIYTDSDLEYIDFQGSGKLYAAGPIGFQLNGDAIDEMDITTDFSGNYLTKMNNPGFGIDLGASYQINEKITVVGSVTDIGSIKWKNDNTGVTFDGLFKWQGTDISDILEPDFSFQNAKTNVLDSLMSEMKVQEAGGTFKTKLPTKIYIGGSMDVNEYLNLGIVNRVSFTSTGGTKNMLMISANSHFNDIISLTGSYAIAQNSYDNLGVGLAVRAGFAQFVLGTGNIINLIQWDKAKYTSVSFGINLMFGELLDDDAVLRRTL